MKKINGLIGTYGSEGIFSFLFDEEKGEFIEAHPYRNICEAKYLSMYHGDLVSLCNYGKKGIVLFKNGKAYYAGDEEHVACYVVQDEHYIYTANYHDGTILRYQKGEEKLTLDCTIHIQEKAGTHQVLLLEKEVFAMHCLLDKMTIYNREDMKLLKELSFPSGSGPRHGCVDQKERYAYIVSELSCDIYCVDIVKREIIRSLNLVSEDIKKAAAAIRMSKDERFLYVSVRDVDKVFVVDIEKWCVVQELDSGGKHPREMNVSQDDGYVFVLNKDSDNITAFKRDSEHGKLTRSNQLGSIPNGVALVFI